MNPSIVVPSVGSRFWILLVIVLVAFVSATATATPIYTSPFLATNINRPPFLVGLADLDGDGNLDAVTLGGDTHTADVSLGGGDGTFGPRASFQTTYGGPYTGALADFDNNGALDLVVAGNYLVLLAGNGDGSFGPSSELVYIGGGDVRAGDLNGDGNPDLAAVNYGELLVFLGHGDLTFTALPPQAVLDPRWMTLVDVDADGDLDVLVSRLQGTAFYVFLGVGDGTFQPAVPYGAGAFYGTTPVVAADLDRDGTLDVVNRLHWYRGRGDGTFDPAVGLVPGGSIMMISLAVDVNGDGWLDLAGPVSNGVVPYGAIGVVKRIPNGGFDPTSTHPATGQPDAMMLGGDLNGDGDADIAYTSGEQLSISLGNGNGTFGSAYDYPVGCSSPDVEIAEVTGDGMPDVVTASAVFPGAGNGTLEAPILLSSDCWPSAEILEIGDVTGDGRPDVVVAAFGPLAEYRHTSLYRNLGGGSFGPKELIGPGCRELVIADYDLDGDLDLVQATSGAFFVSVNNGSGTFTSGVTVATPVSQTLTAADLNDDLRPDVVTYGLVAGSLNVEAYLGVTGGEFQKTAQINLGSQWTPSGTCLASMDANDDGNVDVAVNGFDRLWLLSGQGNGTFMPATEAANSKHMYGLSVGDVDVDGRADFVVGRSDANGVQLMRATGPAIFAQPQGFGTGALPISTAIGDLNGDGYPELVVAHQNSGIVSVLLNRLGTVGVPGSSGLPVLELAITPNPATSRFRASFELTSTSPARLDVYDLAGRRVDSRSLNGLRPGSHVIDLEMAGRPAGIYLVRFVHGGAARTVRACLIR